MFERLLDTILQRFLSNYFTTGGDDSGGGQDEDRSSSWTTAMGVWSGFVSLENLHLRCELVNEKLRRQGQPFEILHCSIKRVELTVPWSKLTTASPRASSQSRAASAEIVVVVDGIHLLARTCFELDDAALQKESISKRRRLLEESETYVSKSQEEGENESSSSWLKEWLQKHLQEGFLPALADSVQVHIRDVHFRLEDARSDPQNPSAVGIVLESIHVQNDDEKVTGSFRLHDNSSEIRKAAQLNHLGVYWNALYAEGLTTGDTSPIPQQRRLLQNLPSAEEITRALDHGIARRGSLLGTLPKHSYVLSPVDTMVKAVISTEPTRLQNRPAVFLAFTLSDMTVSIRDFQCLQLLLLVHNIKELRYRRRFRRFRPSVSVAECPTAWWKYAVSAIRYELAATRLRWSWHRFHRSFVLRQRYCELYEKFCAPSPDAAAGPTPAVAGAIGLTEAEASELRDMEDGLVGDLTVNDIILYRVVVNRRVGMRAFDSTTNRRASWVQRRLHSMVGDDEAAVEEYERLLAYWEQYSEPAMNVAGPDDDKRAFVAVAVQLQVKKGGLVFFSPLSSTSDESQVRRLQERFLDFTYTGFDVGFSLMGDFESMLTKIELDDFVADEARSDRSSRAVVQRVLPSNDVSGEGLPPLFSLLITKNPPSPHDYHIGLQAKVYAVELRLVPDCQWLTRLKALLQPIPQFRKAAQFWADLSMAQINALASDHIGRVLAKAQTALSEHKSIDIDVTVHCPQITVRDGEGSELRVDLGVAYIRTDKLAGVADANLVKSIAPDGVSSRPELQKIPSLKMASSFEDELSVASPSLRPSDTNATPEPQSSISRSFRQIISSHSNGRASGVSEFLGRSMRSVDPLRDNAYLPGDSTVASRPVDSDMDSVFYDIYKIGVCTGKITISGIESTIQELSDSIDIQISLHKSILPSDHTLCRLKLYSTIESLKLSFSEPNVLLLGRLLRTWISVLSSEGSACLSIQKSDSLSPIVRVEPSSGSFDTDVLDVESVVNENEFFDAVESDSYHSESGLGDNWIADTDSAVESETRSLSQPTLRRKRQGSISEVSSLSDTSLTKRRIQFQVGDTFLSPENLARLEETAEDSSGDEDDGESLSSYHSAVSPGYLLELAGDLDRNIQAAEASIQAIEGKISDLQLQQNGGSTATQDAGIVPQRRDMRRALRMELDRSTVELQAMRAARVDILSQVKSAEAIDKDQSFRDQSVRSASQAVALLQATTKRGGANDGAPEQTLTRKLKRDQLQFSFLIRSFVVEYQASESLDADADGLDSTTTNTLTLCLKQSAMVMRLKLGELKLFTSVDHVNSCIQTDSEDGVHQQCLLYGGLSDSPPANLLPARFPQYISSATMEEKFVRAVVELQQGASRSDSRETSRVGRVRLVFGDIELAATTSSLHATGKSYQKLRRALVSQWPSTSDKSDVVSEDEKADRRQFSNFFDIELRVASFRVLQALGSGTSVAVALTELGCRLMGLSTCKVYKNRSQFDVRCGNVQVLSVDDAADVGHEVLGKSDMYNRFVRMRLKNQIVPSAETGGWVVGRDVTSGSVDATNSATRYPLLSSDRKVVNSFASIKLEPFGVNLCPSVIRRLRESMFELQNVASVFLPGSRAEPLDLTLSESRRTPGKGILQVPIRWRIDMSVKQSSITCQSTDFDREDVVNGSPLLVSFSLLATLQRACKGRDGTLLFAALQDVSVSRVFQEGSMLELRRATAKVEGFAKMFDSVNALDDPHLKFLEDPSWSDTELSSFSQSSHENEDSSVPDSAVSVNICTAPIKATVTVSAVVLLADIAVQLLSAVKSAGSIKTTGISDRHHLSGVRSELCYIEPEKRSDVELRIAVEKLYVSIHEEAANSMGKATVSSDAAMALAVVAALITVRKSTDLVSVSSEISDVSVTDYACRPGIRAFRSDTLGIRAEDDPVGDGGDSVPVKFVEMNLHMSRYKGTSLDLKFGRVQCVILPSLLRSLLLFYNGIKRRITAVGTLANENRESEGKTVLNLLRRFHDLDVSLGVSSLELILSSRDLPRYIRESGSEPVGVVSLRLRAEVAGTLTVTSFDEDIAGCLTELIVPGERCEEVRPTLEKFISWRCRREMSPVVGSSSLEINIRDAQVLRTTITRSKSSPCSFHVSPPAEGEQRVTNPFDCSLSHRLTFALLPGMNGFTSDLRSSASQAFSIRADFVDVLFYITQSTGGLTDALRVTVNPCLEILREKDTESSADASESSSDRPDSLGFLSQLSTAFSFKAKGLKVTCVPGGATRLTESPIIKFELAELSCGGAVVAVPAGDVALLSETSLESMTKTSNKVLKHLVMGLWLNCEASASYHNRRLVAWEPFIEPWRLEIQIGIDLVRALNLPPLFDDVVPRLTRVNETVRSPTVSAFDGGVGRLRDIGRLFRSPFRTETPSTEMRTGVSDIIEKDADFCYLLLVLSAEDEFYSSKFHGATGTRTISLSSLPGSDPSQWLAYFGYPDMNLSQSKAETGLDASAVVCSVSDAKPLNVNLTGALIENLSEYIQVDESSVSRRSVPHWIRNDSGLTIRFREVLDTDRLERGEKSVKVTLANGNEAPLSLKRSLSQSCDPHQGFITVELGNFEDTVGRADQRSFVKGSRSSTFLYRLAAKVPVDAVGLHRYPLDVDVETSSKKMGSRRSLGWVIVRIAVVDGVKFVSIESPLVLRNISDSATLCEVRDYDGLSVLWRCLIPNIERNPQMVDRRSFVSVPADIAPFVDGKTHTLSMVALPHTSAVQHETEIEFSGIIQGTIVSPPPPYSKASVANRVINESVLNMPVLPLGEKTRTESIFLNACSVRIGSFALYHSLKAQQGSKAEPVIPEQRLILLRSPLVVSNHLAYPVRVQVRVTESSAGTSMEEDSLRRAWTELGLLDCGKSLSWTGSIPSEKVDIRIQVTGRDGETSRQFPDWSSSATIDAEEPTLGQRAKPQSFSKLPNVKLVDSSGLPLLISVAVNTSESTISDLASYRNVRDYAERLSPSSRIVSLYAPFWIVDGTGLDVQYKCGSFVAGQVDPGLSSTVDSNPQDDEGTFTLGLGELLDDSDLTYLPSRLSFQVLMIGEHSATKLNIRRRLTRTRSSCEYVSSWSESIPLTMEEQSYHDTIVLPPSQREESQLGASDSVQPFALRSRLVRAPERLGGLFGTQLLHIVCRYSCVNQLGWEIEAESVRGQGLPVVILADGRPRPFHFDDSGPIRFRPKEFGWLWSGQFNIRSSRQEITLRLRHKLKGHVILATVELNVKKSSGTCTVVFRRAAHPPYRIENHSIYPLQYTQLPSLLHVGVLSHGRTLSQDDVILPYHNVNFAWDEPEFGRRSVMLQVAEFGDLPRELPNKVLGRFGLDRIPPGTELSLGTSYLVGHVLADGPTLVLRISEPSSDRSRRVTGEQEQIQEYSISAVKFAMSFRLKLSYGIGVSIVDWSPQELVYVCLDDILLEISSDARKESGAFSIASIIVNNQLWVTPYPVLLRMGSRSVRRRNRKHSALMLSWQRSSNTSRAYGDLALLEKLEVSTEPMDIRIDGSLGDLAIKMFNDVKSIETSGHGHSGDFSRNKELKQALDIMERRGDDNDPTSKAHKTLADGLYSAMDFMATAATASKLRSRYRTPNQGLRRGGQVDAISDPSNVRRRSIADSSHKYYLEKLKISNISAEVSWTGSLPVALSLPRLLRPALTFESMPVFLRPFSSSHIYGTAHDLLRSLKSHYLSIWRVFDLTFGVLTKPTLLIRSCVFTARETCAAAFGGVADSLQICERAVTDSIPTAAVQADGAVSGKVISAFVRPALSFNAAALSGLSFLAATVSTTLRYEPARHRGGMGLVRSRNPRLFANIDGKDVLVEYVEGENAGKALLSRVGLGAYLGEGYVYHIEGVFRQKGDCAPTLETKDRNGHILMVTFDRILLLNGQLNTNFCKVIWETSFGDLVRVEVLRERIDTAFSVVVLSYLASNRTSGSTREERYSSSLLTDTVGLVTLHSVVFSVPSFTVDTFIERIAAIDSSLLDHTIVQTL